MTDELKQEMTEKFNSSYGEEVKIGLREALRKVYIHGCEHGYKYAVNKACELIEKLCDSHNIVSIKDGKYKSRSWLEEQFRKAMQ